MRQRIYQIIEKSEGNDVFSSLYDYMMILLILLSLIPLSFKEGTLLFTAIEKMTVVIFIVDYIMRWMTADYKFGEKSAVSFLRYPFSGMAIEDENVACRATFSIYRGCILFINPKRKKNRGCIICWEQ